MTNDQKLVFLMHQVNEYIHAEEKAATTGSSIHKQDATKKRKDLKTWIGVNKIVSTQAPEVRKPKQTSFNYLAK